MQKYSPKALAIATLPNTLITGTNTIEEPKSEHISINVTFLPLTVVPNGGGRNGGKPALKIINLINIQLGNLKKGTIFDSEMWIVLVTLWYR